MISDGAIDLILAQNYQCYEPDWPTAYFLIENTDVDACDVKIKV